MSGGQASAVIDLITPPASPDEPNDDSDVEEITREQAEQAVVGRSSHPSLGESVEDARAEKAAGKRKMAVTPPVEDVMPMDDDVCEQVDEPTSWRAGAASSSAATVGPDDDEEEGDEDVAFMGRTGQLALTDFPHARFNCNVKKFVPGREHLTCPNCYCYVCDMPAAECGEWAVHCKATHDEAHWRDLRAKKKAGAAARPGSDDSDDNYDNWSTSAASYRDRYVTRWSCDQLLKAVEQVYPVETAEPKGLLETVRLRPYQKQSLAFMLDVERRGAVGSGDVKPGDVKPGAAASGKSSKCAAASSSFGSVEPPVRSGWLCDEMGMGKTMCVTALVLANPSTLPPVSDRRFAQLHSEFSPSVHPIPLKLTLMIVNNTLVQQWHDEIVKFAPSLKVHVFYSDAAKKAKALQELREADVLITTPHMVLPHGLAKKISVHRLIMDEAHLLAKGSSTHAKAAALRQYIAPRKWCVTGTPFSTSLEQLAEQARLLGHYDEGIRVKEFVHGRPRADWNPPVHWRNRATRPTDRLTNEEIVDQLRSAMIRHTKAMRIGGEVALALPDADLQTAWLTMSEDEKLLYELHHCAEEGISQYATKKLEACSHLYDTDIVCGKSYAFHHERHATVTREMKAEGTDVGDMSAYHCDTDAQAREMRAKLQEYRELVNKRMQERFGDEAGEPDLERPVQVGSIPAAAAAFLRSHERITVAPKPPGAKKRRMIELGAAEAAPIVSWQSKATLTKFKTLMADLSALREAEPDMRAVVFTRHDLVQARLVGLIQGEIKEGGALATPPGHKPLKIFEFNKHTQPTRRHKLIKDFQDAGGSGARVFIVTYATAAVGITLTAANRVFLMEPCIDPGVEAQAAGRIHRLGQTKEIFIKRYAFKETIEEAIIALHEKFKSGEMRIVDGRIPAGANDAMAQACSSMQQHVLSGPIHDTVATGHEEATWADFRPNRPKGFRAQYRRDHCWRRVYKVQECAICGACRDVRGSSRWSGTGIYEYLNGLTRDPPSGQPGAPHDPLAHNGAHPHHLLSGGHGRFAGLPRPPDNWRGLDATTLDNGEEAPEGGFGQAQTPDLSELVGAIVSAFLKRAGTNRRHDMCPSTTEMDELTRSKDAATLALSSHTIKSMILDEVSDELAMYAAQGIEEVCEKVRFTNRFGYRYSVSTTSRHTLELFLLKEEVLDQYNSSSKKDKEKVPLLTKKRGRDL